MNYRELAVPSMPIAVEASSCILSAESAKCEVDRKTIISTLVEDEIKEMVQGTN